MTKMTGFEMLADANNKHFERYHARNFKFASWYFTMERLIDASNFLIDGEQQLNKFT